MSPEYVPAYVLRVPVRYYRAPPVYFRGWRADAPPRWGQHWGPQWEQAHAGWDHWNRNAVPAPAPIPRYQQQYSGNHYPQGAQQQSLYNQHYRYQPRDPQVQQHYQGYAQHSAPQAGYPQQGRPPGQAQPVLAQSAQWATGPQIHNTPRGPVMTGPTGRPGKRDPDRTVIPRDAVMPVSSGAQISGRRFCLGWMELPASSGDNCRSLINH